VTLVTILARSLVSTRIDVAVEPKSEQPRVRVPLVFAFLTVMHVACRPVPASGQTLSLGPWQVPDSIKQRCAFQPVAGPCPVADTSVLVYDDNEAVRLVVRRDNPCGWSPRAAWTQAHDTVRVLWSFPDARSDVACPAHVHWDAWQTRIAPLVPGPYVVAVYVALGAAPPHLIGARSIALNSPDPIAPPTHRPRI
jgi:hypothetical protein